VKGCGFLKLGNQLKGKIALMKEKSTYDTLTGEL
jgi:hypothetical protein